MWELVSAKFGGKGERRKIGLCWIKNVVELSSRFLIDSLGEAGR